MTGLTSGSSRHTSSESAPRTDEQDCPEPPQLHAWTVQVRRQARLGSGQPGRLGRAPEKGSAIGAAPALPPAGRAGGGLRAVPDEELGAVERPLYLAAAMTGLRQGELIALPWQDIDWLARRIRVADNFPRGRSDRRDSPKSHEGRSVPMADRVVAELERHFQRSFRADTDLVFGHPQTGKPLDPPKLGKRFKRALARAGVREITFTSCATPLGRSSRRLASRCARFRSGWVTRMRRRRRSTATTHPTRRRGRPREGAFARRSNSRSNLSKKDGIPEGLNRSAKRDLPPADPPPSIS